MKLSTVSREDCLALGQLLRIVAQLKVSDMTVAQTSEMHRGMKWLHDLAVDMARVHAEEAAKGSSSSNDAAPVSPSPAGAEGGGFKIKDYHPGAISSGRKRRGS